MRLDLLGAGRSRGRDDVRSAGGSSGYARRAPSGASRSSTRKRGHATSTSSRDRRTRSRRGSHRPSWRTGSRRPVWTTRARLRPWRLERRLFAARLADLVSRRGAIAFADVRRCYASISPSIVGRTLRLAGIGTARDIEDLSASLEGVGVRGLRSVRTRRRSRQRRPRARGPSPAGGRDRPPPVGGRRRPFRTRPRGGGVDLREALGRIDLRLNERKTRIVLDPASLRTGSPVSAWGSAARGTSGRPPGLSSPGDEDPVPSLAGGHALVPRGGSGCWSTVATSSASASARHRGGPGRRPAGDHRPAGLRRHPRASHRDRRPPPGARARFGGLGGGTAHRRSRDRGGPAGTGVPARWDESGWRDRTLPTLGELDRVTERPLGLARVDGHLILVNSAGMEASEAAGQTGVETDDAGAPTGRLTGNAGPGSEAWFDQPVRPTSRSCSSRRAWPWRTASRRSEMSMPADRGMRDLEILLAHRSRLPLDVVTTSPRPTSRP